MKSPRQLLLWIAVGVAAGFTLSWVFPRAYPLFPTEWSISRQSAETIALERLRDLGELPDNPYVVTGINAGSTLEYRLQSKLEEVSAEDLRGSRLGQGLMTWRVTVWEQGARTSEWSFRARVTPGGDVPELLLRVPPDDPGGEIDSEEAKELAALFLGEQGFDLSSYDEPEVRRRQLQARTDLTLRYRDREAILGDEFPYGLEVTFAGTQLTGYSPFFEDPDRLLIQNRFQGVEILSQGWVFVSLLLVPLVAVPFVRRYHAGEIGVERGLHIAATIIVTGIVVMFFAAGSASSGWQIGVLSRQQTTIVVVFQMMILFFFPMAVLSFLGWSVGESIGRERWGAKLAGFDALFKGDWTNSTFAGDSLRGIVSGMLLLAVLLLLTLPMRAFGAWPAGSFYLGPWWEDSSWFAIPMFAFGLGYSLYSGLFARLLLVSVSHRFLGRWLGPAVAALIGAVLFFPTLLVMPLSWSLISWIIGSAGFVFLFLRYGIYTSLLASLTVFVVQGALPFLGAEDIFLQFQASLALLFLAIPLIVSARYLLSERKFQYSYEDIPPHVRRIAERERQKVELETARGIQASILPDLPPEINGVQLAHAYLPATEVGGDFYDVLALEDGRLAVAVGDVAGHGVSSGLVMSMAKSALAVQVTFDPRVESVFRTLNRMVFQSARKRLLSTLCYALIDPERKEMFYASAGHLFPYRVSKKGEVDALESVAYPLGVRAEMDVRVRVAKLEPGDILFLFSDGVVEARAENSDELFGFDRLESGLIRHAGAGAKALRDGILDDLREFTLGAPRDDDLTILVLQLP